MNPSEILNRAFDHLLYESKVVSFPPIPVPVKLAEKAASLLLE